MAMQAATLIPSLSNLSFKSTSWLGSSHHFNVKNGNVGAAAPPNSISIILSQENAKDSTNQGKGRVTPNRSGSHIRKLVSTTKRQLLVSGVAGLAAAFCPICRVKEASAEEWGYGSLSGPLEWSDMCVDGSTQSPVDLPLSAAELLGKDTLGSIQFGYKGSNPSFLNTGHGTMQVDYPEESNWIKVGDKTYNLLQYHFHAPSEHSFDGRRGAMEAHLVHRAETGELAVVGVMLDAQPTAPRNLCLQAALDFAPQEKKAKLPNPVECLSDFGDEPKDSMEPDLCFSLQINPAFLLPKPTAEDGSRSYFHYSGSLTTPPCSEGVEWFMLTSPVKIPGEQVLEFMTYVGDGQSLAMNSRPLQRLGDRMIFLGA